MTILLDGRKVVLDYAGQLEAYLADRLPESQWPGASRDHPAEETEAARAMDMELDSTLPAVPAPEISGLVYPAVGASRYARSIQVQGWEEFRQTLTACWGVTWDGTGDPPVSGSKSDPVTLTYKSPGGQTFALPMYLESVATLDGAGSEAGRQLFALHLVDRRYFLRRERIFVTCDSTTTWDQLIDAWAAETGINVDRPSAIPEAFLQPDPGYFSTDAISAARALDLIADSLGLRVIVNDRQTPRFELVDPADALDDLSTHWGSLEKVCLGGLVNPPPGPEKYTLQLRKLQDHWPDYGAAAESTHQPTSTRAASKAAPPICAAFFLEHYDGAEDTDDTLEKSSRTLADELIEALGDKLALWTDAAFDATWPHVATQAAGQLAINALTDLVSFHYAGDDEEPHLVTRAVSLPIHTPSANFCQRPDLYVHANEVGRFEVLSVTGDPPVYKGAWTADTKSTTPYNGTPNDVTLHLLTDESVAPSQGDTVAAYYQLDQGWYLLEGGGEPSLLTFKVTTAIDSATRIGDGAVVEGLTSGKAQDDPIKLYDPVGVWLDLDVDAIGLAISAGKITDPDNTQNEIDVWVIVHAERTNETYQVVLVEDLYADGQNAVFTWEGRTPVNPLPYRFTSSNPAPTVINPLNVDAPAGAQVLIKRYWSNLNPYTRTWYVHRALQWKARFIEAQITNDVGGGGYLFTVTKFLDGINPGTGSLDMSGFPIYVRPVVGDSVWLRYDPNTNGYFWINDTQYKARWVHGTITIPADTSEYTCAQYNLTLTPGCGGLSYWDGYNPGSIVPAWFDGLPNRCDEDQVIEGTAQYRRETDDYKLISTKSALLGSPTKTASVPTAPFEFTCTSEGICVKADTEQIPIFGCSTTQQPEKTDLWCVSSKELLDCLDICDYICTYCDFFSGEECDPPPPPGECCGDCFIESLDSVTVDGATSTNIERTSACCWDVTLDDGSTGPVCYSGSGEWTISFSPPQGHTGSIAGDCTGGTGVVNAANVTIAATGSECVTRCCDFSDQAEILNFLALFGDVRVEQNGASSRANGGPCAVQFFVPVLLTNDVTGDQDTALATVELFYSDIDACCAWRATIPQVADPDLAHPGTFDANEVAKLLCEGNMNCNNECGDCNTWDDAQFDVNDPINDPQCVPPQPVAAAAAVRRQGIGSMLRRLHPELFSSGCNCGDVANLLDGSTIERATHNRARYAESLYTEAQRTGLHDLTIDEIELRIANAIDAERQRLANQETQQ